MKIIMPNTAKLNMNIVYHCLVHNNNNNSNKSCLSVTKILVYCYLDSLLCYVSLLLLFLTQFFLSLSNAALISVYISTMI